MIRETIYPVETFTPEWSQRRAQDILDLLPDEWDRVVAMASCGQKFEPCGRHKDCTQPPGPDECSRCQSWNMAYIGPGWTFLRGDQYVMIVAPFELMEDPAARRGLLARVNHAFDHTKPKEPARG